MKNLGAMISRDGSMDSMGGTDKGCKSASSQWRYPSLHMGLKHGLC